LRKYEIETQRKFSLSFACIIFFFIGAPLGAIITSVLLLLAAVAPAVAGDGQRCDWEPEACVRSMIQSFENKGWIGIEIDFSDSTSPRVTRVLGDSPAAAAGLAVGDVLVALDGVAYASASEDELREVKKTMVPGREVRVTLLRDGRETVVPLTLGTIPQSVLAQWIGNHLIEGHAHDFASTDDGDGGDEG
jgi:membrane-associated protease RseP (regulator of RpoE activity)